MLTSVIALGLSLLLPAASTSSQTLAKQKACQMPPANGSNKLAFVQGSVGKGFKNPIPVLSYTILEDGSVSNVKLIKGTGSKKLDADVVKRIRSWKYKPQPGCAIDTKITINIDLK
ncbi:MAG: Gram-negative bacterial TonB protein C-terminal [Acidobacteriales bacterium]|nr:Gram-negative bacterial TonB protein C-terminal [Terriglobales bacterium]